MILEFFKMQVTTCDMSLTLKTLWVYACVCVCVGGGGGVGGCVGARTRHYSCITQKPNV